MLVAQLHPTYGQGTFIHTGTGQPLQTASFPFTMPSYSLQPVFQFDFTFATDEISSAGGFLDSFSITVQGANGAARETLNKAMFSIFPDC